MELILVRHGQSEANITGLDMPDAPLTLLGIEQAHSVAREVAALKPDVIASSPLQRALQTAMPVARLLDKRVEVWKEACEVRMGELAQYIGPSQATMRELFPDADFGEDMEQEGWRYNCDLNWQAAQERAGQFLKNLEQQYAGKRLAVFLHGTLNQLLIHAALGLGYPDHRHIYFRQPNGCINRLELYKGNVYVHSIGEASHLQRDGVEIT